MTFPEHRCICRDWIKYSTAVQFSKRKAKAKKDKENILQDEFNNAKQTFEVILPIKMQAINLIQRKKNWNIFMKKTSS